MLDFKELCNKDMVFVTLDRIYNHEITEEEGMNHINSLGLSEEEKIEISEEVEDANDKDFFILPCDCCGKLMISGYMEEDGDWFLCSKKCFEDTFGDNEPYTNYFKWVFLGDKTDVL